MPLAQMTLLTWVAPATAYLIFMCFTDNFSKWCNFVSNSVISASRLEGWVFDPQPLSELP